MTDMVFEFSKWDMFCKRLYELGLISIPACEVNQGITKYIVLKHDVETNVLKALKLAEIEQKYGHRGSYYVQAYLVKDKRNIDLLKQIQQMGHEVSYHYDVMDSNKGNLDKAIEEFEFNRKQFVRRGFKVITVCQHGNPVVERVGYTSNRDFFRSEKVQELYSDVADIMVDYKEKFNTEYSYFSDAGRRFCKIYDPINNDVVNSDDKNIYYNSFNEVFKDIASEGNVIISTHPHRWTNSAIEYAFKSGAFTLIKSSAKLMMHIPGMKKIMSRYYYLAKKI